jgi:F-type H+-transporting ATPase subunit gamma
MLRPLAKPPAPRRWQRSSHGRWSGAHSSWTHSQRPGNEEDHARHGTHRGITHRQGATARCRCRALQRADHRGRKADRGLCGGYNSGVQRATEGSVKEDVLAGKSYSLVTVGRKAEGYFKFRGYNIAASYGGFSDSPTYAQARAIGEDVVARFVAGEFDRVELVYTRFISAGSQEVVLRPLVPLDRSTVEGGDGKADNADGTTADYEFEPDPGTILDTLLPRYVEARIYAALLNAAASEHAFRQRAMKSATDNAEELIKNLSRIMNRARQDSITTEIMEIVSGAEALSGGKSQPKVQLVDLGPLDADSLVSSTQHSRD